MKRIAVLLFSLLISFDIAGQIDSLTAQLKSPGLTGQQKVKIYSALAKAYWGVQLDSSAMYADRAFELAVAIDSQSDIADALVKKAVVLADNGNPRNALELLDQAGEIAGRNKYSHTIAEVYDRKGIVYQQQNQNDSAFVYYSKSIAAYDEAGLKDQVLRVKSNLSFILKRQNKHTELATLYESIIPELEAGRNYALLARTYSYMALNFKDMYEKEKALYYAEKSLAIADKIGNSPDAKEKETKAMIYLNAGWFFMQYVYFDKAEPLLNKSLQWIKETNDKIKIEAVRANLAKLYIDYYGDYARAEEMVDQTLSTTKNPNMLFLKGQILSFKKRYSEADVFLERALEIFRQRADEPSMKNVLELRIKNRIARLDDPRLSEDFDALNSLNVKVNESENKRQFISMETKYRTAEKEAEIQRKEAALAEYRNRNTWLKTGAVFAAVFCILTILFMRNLQKRRELQQANRLLELRHHLHAAELANLNSQLNPHEIKNLITSIAPELISRAPEAYKKMIRLFNVTRASLSSSLTERLEKQLQQTDDFLQLQQSISPYPWSYRIGELTERIASIELPRLLLKNLAENAVRHGMKSVKENGLIRITLSEEESCLVIRVEDNGRDEIVRDGQTGVGIANYQSLFNLTNAHNDRPASLTLERKQSRTEAEIRIPFAYRYQS